MEPKGTRAAVMRARPRRPPHRERKVPMPRKSTNSGSGCAKFSAVSPSRDERPTAIGKQRRRGGTVLGTRIASMEPRRSGGSGPATEPKQRRDEDYCRMIGAEGQHQADRRSRYAPTNASRGSGTPAPFAVKKGPGPMRSRRRQWTRPGGPVPSLADRAMTIWWPIRRREKRRRPQSNEDVLKRKQQDCS